MEHELDPVASQHLDQSGDVILVRMGEEHHVDLPPPERKGCAELAQRPIRVGPTVHEQRRPIGGLDQDRIPLADVEGRDMQPAVG